MTMGNRAGLRPVGVKVPVDQGKVKETAEPYRVLGLMKFEMYAAKVSDGQGKVSDALIFVSEKGDMYLDPTDRGEFVSRLKPVHDRLEPELKKALNLKKGKPVEAAIPTKDSVDPLG